MGRREMALTEYDVAFSFVKEDEGLATQLNNHLPLPDLSILQRSGAVGRDGWGKDCSAELAAESKMCLAASRWSLERMSC